MAMAWYTWVLLLAAAAVAVWIWSRLYRDTSVVSCVGCGKCAATGECVYVKEARKKARRTAKMTPENQEKPGK
jgi:hypothetical protein